MFEDVLSKATHFDDSAERTIWVHAEFGTVIVVADSTGSYCAVKSPTNIAIVISALEQLSAR